MDTAPSCAWRKPCTLLTGRPPAEGPVLRARSLSACSACFRSTPGSRACGGPGQQPPAGLKTVTQALQGRNPRFWQSKATVTSMTKAHPYPTTTALQFLLQICCLYPAQPLKAKWRWSEAVEEKGERGSEELALSAMPGLKQGVGQRGKSLDWGGGAWG